MTRPIFDHVHAMRERLARDERYCERCGESEFDLKALREPMFDVPRRPPDMTDRDRLLESMERDLASRPPPLPRDPPVARLPSGRRTAAFVALMAFCGLVVSIGAHQLETEADDLRARLDLATAEIRRLTPLVERGHRYTIEWDPRRECVDAVWRVSSAVEPLDEYGLVIRNVPRCPSASTWTEDVHVPRAWSSFGYHDGEYSW